MRKSFVTVVSVLMLSALPASADPATFRSATEFFQFRTPNGWNATENAKEGAVSATYAPAGQTRAAMRITYGETKLADEPAEAQHKALRAHAASMASGDMLKSAMPDMTIEDKGVEETRVGGAFAVRRVYVASDASGPVRTFVYEHFIQSGLWFAVSYAYAAGDSESKTGAEALLASFTFA